VHYGQTVREEGGGVHYGQRVREGGVSRGGGRGEARVARVGGGMENRSSDTGEAGRGGNGGFSSDFDRQLSSMQPMRSNGGSSLDSGRQLSGTQPMKDSGGYAAGTIYVSIFDGVTRYAPGTTVCHPAAPDHGGGLYVSPTIEGCLRRDANMFPAASALLAAPRAIARVHCWNPDRMHDPVFYGAKLAFTCVHVVEILPYPSTWGVGIAGRGGQNTRSAGAPQRVVLETRAGRGGGGGDGYENPGDRAGAAADTSFSLGGSVRGAGSGGGGGVRGGNSGRSGIERRAGTQGLADLEARAQAAAAGESSAASVPAGRAAERAGKHAASLVRAQVNPKTTCPVITRLFSASATPNIYFGWTRVRSCRVTMQGLNPKP